MTSPILSLDLAQAGINTIIWATGYAVDYSWLNVNAFNEQGPSSASARRLQRTGCLLPRPAVVIAPGINLYLGRLARREAYRRPYRYPP